MLGLCNRWLYICFFLGRVFPSHRQANPAVKKRREDCKCLFSGICPKNGSFFLISLVFQGERKRPDGCEGYQVEIRWREERT
jgi:hypothetical protein